MAVGINAVVVVGNLTKDVELRYTAGAEPVALAGLRIAVNGREKVNGQWQDRADFFDVRVWGNQAESCSQYLSKGSKICVDGRLRHEEWNSDDKGKQSRVLIVARSVQFLDKQGDGGHKSAAWMPDEEFKVPDADFSTGSDSFAPAGSDASTVDDDIPF